MKRLVVILTLLGLLLSHTGCNFAERVGQRLGRIIAPPVISPNTDWRVFDNAKEWTAISGKISGDSNYSNGPLHSLYLSHDGAGTAEAIRSINTSFGHPPRMRLRVFFHDQPAKLAIQLSSSLDFSSYFSITIGEPLQALQQGWNTIDIYPPAWEIFGEENWGRAMKGLRFQVIALEGNSPPAVSWDQIIVNMDGVAGVMLTFDDGPVSVYTRAFDYMKTVNARATAYVITNRVGSNDRYVTVEQLQEMDAFGWSIANHSPLHNARLADLKQSEIETQLRDAREALENWGMPKASRHVAYPWGSWNNTVIDAMTQTGMLTGRNTDYRHQVVWPSEGQDYFLGTRMIGPDTPLEGVKSWVDEAIFYNRIVVICLHDIVDYSAGRMQWLTQDLIALVDYIQERGIPLLTINDYHTLAQGFILGLSDSFQVEENNTLFIHSPGVLENDLSFENFTLLAQLEESIPPDEGRLEFDKNGSFSYTPPVGWTGSTEFSYRSCNNDGLCSDLTYVKIEVIASP